MCFTLQSRWTLCIFHNKTKYCTCFLLPVKFCLKSQSIMVSLTHNRNITFSKWSHASDFHRTVYQHLACYVPKIYCLGPNLNPQNEELLAQLLLLAPLEWYLCDEDPSAGLAKLEQSNQPSQLCGHVFKVGEPTYSCRECAADPTCVLCMQCFLGSVHKEHRYRMTTSGGGGFCDCGDTEAWKKGPYCQKHEPNISDTSQEDPLAHLSSDMIARTRSIFSIVLKYSVDMLTWEKEDELPSGLEPLNTSRQTKPLRVQVMHSSVVAHQCFALKALGWLSHVIGYSDALRRILCQVGLEKTLEGENSSLVDTLMLCDSKMWKGARNVYHQLLMSSLLMDLKYKKLFAIQFAKNYERLQSDYVKDDHDREFSVTDLSVQMFTVPSLARMLIMEENLMTTIIRTFVDHLRHRDQRGRFQFERYTAQQAFKFRRVQSLIGDLKYVLISRPTEWSDKLREKFLEGFSAFLELLKCMQGMDPVVRQVGQHIEMEPEWEAAFTLQMKLTHIISMMQEWCASDEKVLVEAYKFSLAALTHCHGGFTDGEQPITLSMSGHSVDTIRYCVSQEKVSIHLPVSRLLAGLHVLLSKTEVAYRFPEQLPLSELSPPMLIEHPLRCLVLCAQVHAGMWRRNGFSLVNQIYYYHNVKCRVEMFDKDLIMLQAGASMMDPNHFLMIVLSRFELYHIFSSADYRKRYNRENANKDIIQQNNTLIEEMLHLIMMVVGERFAPGIGMVQSCDEIKREIIHQLCIRPMAHSELVKALPENENKETGMERVIDSVASFKKPGVTGRGLYELRPECAKQFNLYFHHYSRADQSKAEEAQRKLKRQNGEDSALPPPVLPPLCPLFASLVNLLQCDVLLAMLGTVLQWAVEPSGGHWSESMLQRVLHLIGMALLEEQQQLENSIEENDVGFNFTLKISRPGEAPSNTPSILALLETLQNAPHLEVHKDMIRWILKTVAAIKTMRERTTTAPETDAVGQSQEETVRDKDKAERKRKAEMARLRREKIMAQMSEMQRHFINENKELFQQSLEELEASTSASLEHSPTSPDTASVCVGPRRSRPSEKRLVVTCILCQEEQEVREDGRAMVLAAFVQRSTVMSKNRRRPSPNPERYDPLFMHPDLSFGTHTGSCGHIMHSHCWQRYFEAVQAKEQRRQQRLRVHTSYDVENGEFLCPLCECLSNTVIPLLPLTRGSKSSDHPGLGQWLGVIGQQVKALHSAHKKLKPVGESEFPVTYPNKVLCFPRDPYSSSIKEMLTTFGTATYKIGLKVHPNEQDPRVPIMCWTSCAYTIQSIVMVLSWFWDPNPPCAVSFFQDDCLQSLIRFSSACWTTSSLPSVQNHFIRLLAVSPSLSCISEPTPFLLLSLGTQVSLVLSYSSVHCQDSSGLNVDSAQQHFLQVVTLAHVVQVLLTSIPAETTMDQETGAGSSEEEAAVCLLYGLLRRHLVSDLYEVTSGWHLWRCVKAGVLPYLRSAALFFHHLNGVPAPPELHGKSSTAYLSYTLSLSEHFHKEYRTTEWCETASCCAFFPRESNRLIDLPDDYSALINQASSFTCPKSGGDKSRAPTLCLVCGTMLCSQSYCCQAELDGEDVGACTAHTFTCGSGVGIFLRVRESQVLFLAGKTKGCFYAPPYLDDYGETDQGLRRGNPLHLCRERYRKIQKLWRQHGITEEIGHAQEANQTLVGIDWQHL
uniref:E3 ubiquitin-protein ligase n=1 Tax=Scleropages formosus TaxID=113540 RepID=A0A8C9W3E4_SCLFO